MYVYICVYINVQIQIFVLNDKLFSRDSIPQDISFFKRELCIVSIHGRTVLLLPELGPKQPG